MPDRDLGDSPQRHPEEIELEALLDGRLAAGADRAAVDAAIYERFACERAIMMTDLVGFSRQVETFGILHFLQIIRESERLFLPLIAQHKGCCLKREGDSMLVVFHQAVDALACAIAMRSATHAFSLGRPENERIDVCIGLGFGRVLRVGDREVWGAEVNAASKLGEDIAEGGEILVTDQVRERGEPDGHCFVRHGEVFGTRPIFRLI